MFKRLAQIVLTADPAPLDRGLKRSKSSLDAFKKSVGRSFGDLFSTLKTAGGIGGIGIAGLFGVEAVKALKFQENLTRLGIASGQSGEQMATLAGHVKSLSDSSGVAREDLLGAANAFFALTGDARGASDNLALFSKVQRATGAEMDDLARTAAALQQNLKISPAELEKSFSILIRGGKAGAIELKDVAQLLASFAPLAAQFEGGLGTSGLADIAAALQLARQGFGTSAEAATGLEALMGSIVKHADRLKSGGVEVFNTDKNGNKTLKSLQAIVESIGKSKLAKDPMLLVKAFGTKEAYQTYLQLVKVKGAWGDLADSTKGATDVAQDYAAFNESTAGKISIAWNQIKNQIAETFTPERLAAFGAVLEGIVKVAARLASILAGLPGLGEDIADGAYDRLHPSEKQATPDAIKALGSKIRNPYERARFNANAGGLSMSAVQAEFISAYGELPKDVTEKLDAEERRRKEAPDRARRGMQAGLAAVGAPAYGIKPPEPQTWSAESDAADAERRARSEFGRGPVVGRTPTRSGGSHVRVTIGVDPATQNLDAAVANGRGHTVRP